MLACSSIFSSASAADAPAPFGAIPTPQQVDWQRLEYYAFVHFGLNTWTDREWGYGDEDPKLFNPDDFDAFKITELFKNAGMKGVMLTAKHHDGFCSWPTKTTPHNISKSPWRGGKGDLVKEFATAAKKSGIKFGTYLSPWDRNHPEYGREGYIKAYYAQIAELLTNYGPVFEIWFDGANGGDGYYGGARESRSIGSAEQYYNFPKVVENIRKMQPDCIIWGAGSAGDARWGGSEQGHVNYPHWATMGNSTNEGIYGTGERGAHRWLPAEGDTSIRHGWFWHESANHSVKSPEKLLKLWFDCVGRGANLILNVPPDKRGHIYEADIKSLLEFKALRDKLYSKDFVAKAKVTASEVRGKDAKFDGSKMTDDDIESYWAVEDGNLTPSAEITLTKPTTFDVIRLREQIRLGQRVDSFEVDAWVDGAWTKILDGKTIGNQAMLQLPQPVTTDKLRLRITGSQATPCISEFALFITPVILSQPNMERKGNNVTLSAPHGCTIHYTVDGTQPTKASPSYQNAIPFAEGGVIKAVSFDDKGNSSPTVEHRFSVSKANWKLINATAGEGQNAIDDNSTTFWHTHQEQENNPPQSITVDMGADYPVKAFSYLPRQDGTVNGMTDRYQFELSKDGKKWVKLAEGEFSNLRANPIEQVVPIKMGKAKARYFRFTGTRAIQKNHVSAAEISIYTK